MILVCQRPKTIALTKMAPDHPGEGPGMVVQIRDGNHGPPGAGGLHDVYVSSSDSSYIFVCLYTINTHLHFQW